VTAITRIDVPVRGGSLAAFRFGAPDPDATLVLAAHGITANSRSWLPVARALDGRAQLIAPDLRGRGESRSLPEPFGMAAHAADLIAVLDHVGAERAVLAGHSMGAYVAARVGADHPNRLEAAVLVDGGLVLPGSEGVDPQAFLDAFLGPSIERLRMRFESPEAYRAFWRDHPAFKRTGVSDEDLAAFRPRSRRRPSRAPVLSRRGGGSRRRRRAARRQWGRNRARGARDPSPGSSRAAERA
jgi:pimeloyl-ACP methyl ester carboxylesterase